jgi:hypothetical protein
MASFDICVIASTHRGIFAALILVAFLYGRVNIGPAFQDCRLHQPKIDKSLRPW